MKYKNSKKSFNSNYEQIEPLDLSMVRKLNIIKILIEYIL